MKRKRSIAGLSLIAVLVLAIGAGCAPEPVKTPSAPPPTESNAGKTGPFQGMQAPDFTLKDIGGTEWQLSELKGSSVALIFFTSW